MRDKKYWVYDLETIVNCFIAVFESLVGDERHVFVIHKTQDDTEKLIEFLEENIKHNDWHLGYNNLAFDSQLIEYIIDHKEILLNQVASDTAQDLYHYAQHVISLSNTNQFLDYPEFKLRIQALDVYKINHWDNKNKMSSLKWIQYSMDWENVEEMPHDFREPIITDEQLNMVISYCINDVRSTKKVFKLSINAINLRLSLKHKYKINCLNYSNTKIGSELLLDLYCKRTKLDKKEIKQKGGTIRSYINIKDVIFPYIAFKSEPLKQLLKELNELVIYNTKGDFQKTVIYQDYEFNMGLGGIHQCNKSGIYKAEENYIIIDSDVKWRLNSLNCWNAKEVILCQSAAKLLN